MKSRFRQGFKKLLTVVTHFQLHSLFMYSNFHITTLEHYLNRDETQNSKFTYLELNIFYSILNGTEFMAPTGSRLR